MEKGNYIERKTDPRMIEKVKRVAILGPESSGKSELCQQLATHYQTKWVPEFARSYLTKLTGPYTIGDIIEIYNTQFGQEQELLKEANKYLFTDTEFIIAKVWCEHLFDKCPVVIEEMIKQHPYDLYLLTAPDLPWEYDPLRENPGKGHFFYDWYLTILKQHNLNFGIVSGTGRARVLSAINVIENQNWKK